jgi:hypothetical protein
VPRRPSAAGTRIGPTAAWLEGSPLPDFRFPGLFLAVVIAGANLLSASLLRRRHPLGPPASLGTGLPVAWVAIQTAIIGFRHWSQGIWWLTFLLVAALGPASAASERDVRPPSQPPDQSGAAAARGDARFLGCS